jgi:hypothetical protein
MLRRRKRSAYSAGIMLFASIKGTACVLLGLDGVAWSDFGGRSETEDVGLPLATALRELDEETLGSVPVEMLSVHPTCIESRTVSEQPYYLFMATLTGPESETALVVRSFLAALSSTAGTASFVEKTDVRWFAWSDVLAMPESAMRPVFYRTLQEHKATIGAMVGELGVGAGTKSGPRSVRSE